jgi:four helix bundle protein
VFVFRVRDRPYGGKAHEERRRSRRFQTGPSIGTETYSVTKTFPKEETFSLVDQMRRAASSVGMNLMEGAMRLGRKEYRQFVGIARGSAGEVCYQLILAKDLKYMTGEVYGELRSGYDRVIQMLSRLSQTLNR